MLWRVLWFVLLAVPLKAEVDLAFERRALRDAPLSSERATARGDALRFVLGELAMQGQRLTPEFRQLVHEGQTLQEAFAEPDEERLIALAVVHSVAVELAADARRGVAIAPVAPARTLIHQATALTRQTDDRNHRPREIVLAAATMIRFTPPFKPAGLRQPNAQVDRDLRGLFERIAGRAPGEPEAPAPASGAPLGVAIAALAVLAMVAWVVWRAWIAAPAPRPRPAPEPSPLDKLAAHLPPRYTKARRIGIGRTGVVFEVEDTTLSRPVAIKMLSPELRADDAACQRFVKEARGLAALSHPGVLTVYDVQPEPWPYLAMELLDGASLEKRLGGKPLADDEFYRIALNLLDALEHVHRAGFVHKDIKPEHIFVRRDGTALITEFGRAGTPQYMAPEQLEGGAVDGRADLYAMGLVLHRMLAGCLPVPEDDPRARLAGARVSELAGQRKPLEPVLERALKANPAERYFSARDVATDLRAARAKAKG